MGRVEVEKEAEPVAERVAVPRTVDPLLKVTVPVATVEVVLETVAEKGDAGAEGAGGGGGGDGGGGGGSVDGDGGGGGGGVGRGVDGVAGVGGDDGVGRRRRG